jgi:L-2,4-diaminobutyrate decarboxylase
MIAQSNSKHPDQDVPEILLASPSYEDIFHEGTSAEYLHAMRLASQSVVTFLQDNQKPFSGVTASQLRPHFDAIDLDTPLPDYETLMSEVESLYTRHAVAFHHPKYVAHLNCPVVIPAIAAEVLISAINSSLDTWDQSAGGTLIEQKMIEWTCKEIGFDKNADGVFTSGGSQSNLMGLLLARDHYSIEYLNHNIKINGLSPEASRFRIFVSEAGHFSIQKNASLLGLGEKSVVKIKTNRSFRMNTVLLEDAIQRELEQGNIPIAIVATAGTTDFGNIDPLEEIGYIAAKYKLWYHIDAAYGCGLLLSNKHRHLLKGIELADSVTTDYHKAFYQPVSSSAFIVNHHRYFGLITHYADYLNPKDQHCDEIPNQVNKSIQTTRRFDALKLWFTLRIMGKEKLGSYIEKVIDTAEDVAHLISIDTDFELLSYSDISALVFRYNPSVLQPVDLTRMNQYIKSQLFKAGDALVAGTKLHGEFYLKFTLLNPLTTTDHIKTILLNIKNHGNEFIELN